jgi:tryptophan synthase alpha chain
LSDETLRACWHALAARGQAALIPYITAGFPDRAATRAMLDGAGAAGASLVELGVPWSDPVADGPVIQASSHAALAAGMTLPGVLELLAGAAPAVPVVIMSYLNPILRYGPARFAADARAAGAAALLVTDLPAGADPAVESQLGVLPLVRLVAPTTTPARLAAIAAAARGFLYLVARTGVTGAGEAAANMEAQIAAIRAVSDLPVAVGFGIGSAADAARVARVADGVVVGSAVVRRLEQGGAAAALAFVRELREGLDQARRAA